MPDPTPGPIDQDVSQASQVPLQVAPEGPVNAQPPMQSGPVQNSGQPVAPSTQDATAGSPQPDVPASVAQAPKTAQPDYKESGWHKIAGALAGGTHNATYRVDPDTGKIGVELKPKTGREEIMGAVANILSGMAAGAGQKNFYKGFSAGAQQVSQQLQQQRGQQRQESIDDYNQQQQAKVQKAQAMHTNLQMLALAQDIGRKDKEDHDAMVAAHADNYEDLKEQNVPGADKIVGEEDLKNISGSDMIPIPVGTVPRIDPNTHQQSKNELGIPQWNNTYVVVPKNATVSLTDEEGKPKNWVTQAQSWGVMPDKKVSPQTLPYRVAAGIDHTVAALNSFNTELKNFATKINVPPVDLKAALKADPTLKSALQKFQKTVGMSTQPDIQIDALRQKDPDAAAKIANLFGPDNLEKYKEKRLADTKAGETAAETTARATAEANTPIGQQKLTNEKLAGQEKQLQIQKLQKDLTGFDLSKISTNPVDAVSNPDGTKAGISFQPDANYRVDNGVLQQMQTQDSGLAATVKAIGEGREVMTPQAQRTKDGQAILKAVNLAYPDYNAVKVQSYLKGRETGTSGTLGNKVNSFATAMDHLGRYYDNINAIASTAGVGSVASELGLGTAKELDTDRTALASEIASAYKGGGVASEPEIKSWKDKLGGSTVWAQKKGATETAKLLQGKFHEYSNQYRNMIPGGLRDDNFQLMSDRAAQSYEHVTGEKIGNIHPFTQGENKGFTIPPGAPTPPTQDGKYLKLAGKDVAVSKGGQWVQIP